MFLKRIEICGFKSFADKIGLDFDLGVTCIVGPNGSGKSNISDCIRWVLGEQSAKSLRGGKMEDIIFVGTQYRKSMGYAKVSLILDNQDESLPIDYEEVVITRKIYRSGDSEFYINNNQCRLKDIHELLMDTGIGRDGYSIIGQGRVDEILSTKSEDRRAIFEEASGIVKYKTRKSEALKKLDQTSQNLERINDTITVLEEQLTPLEGQSIKAKKYKELTKELKQLEVLSYIDRIKKTYESQKEVNQAYKESEMLVKNEEQSLKQAEDKYKLQNVKLEEINKKIEETKNMYYQNEGNLGKFTYEIKLDEEKLNSANLNIFRLKDELNRLNAEVVHAKKEEKNKKDRLIKLQEKEKSYQDKLSNKESKLQDIANNLTDKQQEMEKLNDNYLEKLNEKTVATNYINNASNLLEGIALKKSKITQDINRREQELKSYKINKDAIFSKIKETQDSLIKENDNVKALETNVGKLKKTKEEDTEKLHSLIVSINSDISRRNLLEDLENNLEGYTKSVKVILKLCEQNKEFKKGVHGVLLKLLTVPCEMEIAIEVALGNALQYIVTDTEQQAKKIIEYLKANNLGRATFLPISSVMGKEFEKDKAQDISRCKGFVGFAHNLISYHKIYEGIILSFLGKIVVVSDLQAGIDMAKKFNHTFKIVTLKGEFLNIGGSITGGSTNTKETGLMSRGRKLKELQDKINIQKDEESKLKKKIDDTLNTINAKRQELQASQNRQKDYEMTLLKDISYKERLEGDTIKYQKILEEIQKEQQNIIKEEKETIAKHEKYQKELTEIEKSLDDIQVMVLKNKEKHKNKLMERENLQGDIMQIKIDINKVLEAMQNLHDLMQREAQNVTSLEESIKEKTEQKDNYQKDIKAFNARIDELKVLLGKENQTKDETNKELEKIENLKKDKQKEIEQDFTQLQKINKNIILLKEEFNKAINKKSKVDDEINYLKDKLWEDYELTYQNAMELNKDVSIKVSMKTINDLKAKIKGLGEVNTGAIEEYQKLKEHYDFITVQRKDMEQAKNNLKKVISEITQVMKEQFVTQFELINKNFNIVFNELFEGGRAKLVLEDEEHVLESGIQIHVQPPGKKLQNMMLLSGGERAFTAIALLFAIIKLRPAPFCILDEIEAALDDANVYKFADYIKKHVDLSQFILITHRKGTMEAADTIYGVTMQEQGISKVVSLKLEQLEKE